MPPSRRTYPLNCLHTFVAESIPPRHGDLVWCARCGDYRMVGVPPVDRYIVNCANCKRMAHRDYGSAYVTAETRAATHSLKHPGHHVTLRKNGEVVRVFHHPAIEIDEPNF